MKLRRQVNGRGGYGIGDIAGVPKPFTEIFDREKHDQLLSTRRIFSRERQKRNPE